MKEKIENNTMGITPKNKRGSFWKTVGNVAFYLVMALILVWAFWFSRSDDPTKSVFGYRFYYIQRPSMEPDVPVGAAIFTKITDPGEIKVGDVITYYLGDTRVSHQVIEIQSAGEGMQELWFRTKGVANEEPDPELVPAEAVAGVMVLCIPGLGFVMSWIGEHMMMTLWLFGLICVLCVLVQWLVRESKKEPKEPQEQPCPQG